MLLDDSIQQRGYMATYILAIDQGTTGTTSLVVKFSPGTEKPVEVVSVLSRISNIFRSQVGSSMI